ncbi:glucosaminidase domain-containing protein [Hyphomicrobium sp.]|uniref:glucosaminidase domain-containing protein n=1 Tax=Hyphomicrobium sp. TaxID=82 RepID=UPI002FDEAEEE
MACRSRSSRFSAAVIAPLLFMSGAAGAAELPPIRTGAANNVADCATPGRLTAYLRERNPKLDPRYEGLAAEYMRHGEALGVRWDYAFFQMILETGSLAYGGDVRPEQNNFAGLGATGRGVRGESFKDISTGARAHLEHLVLYSGETVENPVAERTRNIQAWGVLTDWQKKIKRPITFSDLAKKWAPGSRRYASDMQTIALRFFDGACKEPDPVMAAVERKPKQDVPPAAAKTANAAGLMAAPGKGAANVAASAGSGTAPKASASVAPPLTVLNPTPSEDAKAEAAAAGRGSASASAKGSADVVEVAALPGGLSGAGKNAAPQAEKKPEKNTDKKDAASPGKCRVWTASYGGAKAIIIKAEADKTVNYTVLDVNEGAEKREAEAYINAYAKGGKSVGEFPSQALALEKAFELCPEG